MGEDEKGGDMSLEREFQLQQEAKFLRQQLAEQAEAIDLQLHTNRSIAELEQHLAEWFEKAKNWMASPEAGKQLDGYREMGSKCAELEAENDQLRRQQTNETVEFMRYGPTAIEIRMNDIKQERDQLRQQVTLLLELANRCRIELVVQIHELADHIERARGCITDPDMLKQINGQREYALKVADRWDQNGNPFEALAATKEN